MGLFKKKADDPTVRPATTIDGYPQNDPEQLGQWARRQRLYAYVERVLANHPAAQADAFGAPLGDGLGMEEIVDTIRPLFANEGAILKWVALRGALHALSELGIGWGNSVVLESVGLTWSEQQQRMMLADGQIPPGLADGAIGLAGSIFEKAVDYDQISSLSIDEVLTDQRWRLSSVNQAIALDYIAWCAIVLNRLEAKGFLPPSPVVPAPSRLDTPGWYVDPIFAKTLRYWDGSDWTNRVQFPPDHPNFKNGELTLGI